MINYNKLYAGIFSTILVYVLMTIFELIFFIFSVSPEITESIHELFKSYSDQNQNQNQNYDNAHTDSFQFPMKVANVLSEREYRLIDQTNFNSYLIIAIIILLLISLLFYLYAKINVIENRDSTEAHSLEHSQNIIISPIRDESEGARVVARSRSISFESSRSSENNSGNSRNSNITTRPTTKKIYLKHAIKCAISIITCLVFFQIFFYNYGLAFKYVGSTEELIVLFVTAIRQ